MHVNRMFRIAAALLPLLAAGCSDPDGGPGKPLEITLSAQTLELERSETGCLRFALTPWNDAWSVSRVEITAAPGGSFTSGCTVTGWSGPVGGQFSLFVTDPATGQALGLIVCGGCGSFRSEKSQMEIPWRQIACIGDDVILVSPGSC